MLASTVTDDETSWKPDGIAKQYGEPAGEIFVPEQLSDRRALPPGEDEPLGPGEPEALGPLPRRVASAATVPVPETVLAHPASSPQRPIRATAKRLRMGPPYPGLGTYRAIRWYRSSPARTHRAQGSYRTVTNYARSVPEGGIELGRMRWWHVAAGARAGARAVPGGELVGGRVLERAGRDRQPALRGRVARRAGRRVRRSRRLRRRGARVDDRGHRVRAAWRDRYRAAAGPAGRGRAAPGAAGRPGRQPGRAAAVRAARFRIGRHPPPVLPTQRHRR